RPEGSWDLDFRDLVDGRSGNRAGRARPAARLRRRAHHGHQRHGSRDPMSPRAERRTFMSSTKSNGHRNLAARMGGWSAAHWKTATFGWLAFVAIAFLVGNTVGTKSIDPNTSGPGESGRMDRILADGFKLPANESVLVQSRSLRVGEPAFDAAVTDVVAR